MTVFATIAFAAFLFENDNFLTFHQRNEHFALDLCSFHGRSTDFNVAVGIEKKHFVESDSVALFYFLAEVVNIQIFAFFGFELLSFDFYDSVHLNY